MFGLCVQMSRHRSCKCTSRAASTDATCWGRSRGYSYTQSPSLLDFVLRPLRQCPKLELAAHVIVGFVGITACQLCTPLRQAGAGFFIFSAGLTFASSRQPIRVSAACQTEWRCAQLHCYQPEPFQGPVSCCFQPSWGLPVKGSLWHNERACLSTRPLSLGTRKERGRSSSVSTAFSCNTLTP